MDDQGLSVVPDQVGTIFFRIGRVPSNGILEADSWSKSEASDQAL